MQVLYRFVILYFFLYFLPFPISAFAGLSSMPAPLSWIGAAAGFVGGGFDSATNAMDVWVGENVLRLPAGAVIIQPTGSGDTMVAYVQTFCVLMLAAIGTVIWSIVARGRPIPDQLVTWFRVYLRYALATILLGYGFAKVPPLQFQPPGPELLVRTYGESSPMGLLWTFMGSSMAYTMFAGVMEIIPGLLLLFRQTATLGALIGAATLTNIVALNFAYDVPVKLFSAHLLATALVVAAPDVRRLLNFFVLNRPASAAVLRAPLPAARKWMFVGVKVAFVLVVLSSNIIGAYQAWYMRGPGSPPPPLAGVYDVESFSLNGETRPPLWTDATRWRRFLVARRGSFVVVQWMGGKNERFSLKHDAKTGAFVMGVVGGKETFSLASTANEDGGLVLEGPFRDGQVRVELKKVVDAEFPLNTRGFNWIQELPYNR